jgi:hypothetical protein
MRLSIGVIQGASFLSSLRIKLLRRSNFLLTPEPLKYTIPPSHTICHRLSPTT